MSKIKFYFIVLIATIAITSCNKNDDNITIPPPKDYTEQYNIEKPLIETYLKTNYITIIDAPGLPEDQSVTITPIPTGGTQTPIFDYAKNANTTTFPQLLYRIVEDDGIEYKLYYLVLRKGTGERPCNVDDVFTSYNGKYLIETTTDEVTTITSTQFQEVLFPQKYLNLFGEIRGWKEIFPQFGAGNTSSNDDGTVAYTNFGAGVMFIPSGLAYYNTGGVSIPAYAPLVFSFKLYQIRRSDLELSGNGLALDPDGVLSYQEDKDGDGYMWTTSELPRDASGNLLNPNPDDSDGDGIPDFLDFDDDGDGYSTLGEIKKADGTNYPFELIPDCKGNIPTDINKKRHLDPECHIMNQ